MENKKTWMPTTAGILDIISGSCGLMGVFVLIVSGGVMRAMADIPKLLFLAPFLMALSVPLAIVSILAIVGGIYALQRKNWGVALAGSIAASFTSWPLGVAAIIFTAVSKKEFE